MKYYDLDEEEKQIVSDFENDEFVSVPDVEIPQPAGPPDGEG